MFRSGPSARVCLATVPLRARRSTSAGGVSRHRPGSHIVNLYSRTNDLSRGPGRRTYHSSSGARKMKTSASCLPNSYLFLFWRCASRPSSGERLCTSDGPRCRDGHTSSSRAAGTPSPRRRRPFCLCAFGFGCAFWLYEPSSDATATASQQCCDWVSVSPRTWRCVQQRYVSRVVNPQNAGSLRASVLLHASRQQGN